MTRPLVAAALAGAPLVALAHAGADGATHHGFASGFAHPFTGLDHLAAMLAVGLWSALALRPGAPPLAVLRAPLVFAAALIVGAVLAAAGVDMPAVEPMIAASLLALGMASALRLCLPDAAALSLVAAFALFHGAAHGRELDGAAALAGMLAASVLLHLAGIGAGRLLRERSVWWGRLAGAGVGVFGAALLLG